MGADDADRADRGDGKEEYTGTEQQKSDLALAGPREQLRDWIKGHRGDSSHLDVSCIALFSSQ